MNKNYYEILEVDRHASEEIIKKAYNTLAKKYHPDLKPEDLKPICEEKFKLINKAYETLSIPEKREKYDSYLKQTIISKEDYDAIYAENQRLKNIIEQIKNRTTQNTIDEPYSNSYSKNNIHNQYTQQKYYQEYMNNIQQAKQQAYQDAYIQDLKNRGYQIRYKQTFKEHFKNFIALCLTGLILFILWQIPFIKNIFIDSYYDNQSLQSFINFLFPK